MFTLEVQEIPLDLGRNVECLTLQGMNSAELEDILVQAQESLLSERHTEEKLNHYEELEQVLGMPMHHEYLEYLSKEWSTFYKEPAKYAELSRYIKDGLLGMSVECENSQGSKFYYPKSRIPLLLKGNDVRVLKDAYTQEVLYYNTFVG